MVAGWVVDKGGIGEFLIDVAIFDSNQGEFQFSHPTRRLFHRSQVHHFTTKQSHARRDTHQNRQSVF